MREVVVQVPPEAVEDVLDRLLPLVPGGVREREASGHVELVIRGEELPALAEIVRAAGRSLHRVFEREVSDDWRVRRLTDYEPDVIGGRLMLTPDWAVAADRGHEAEIELTLTENAAFGAGTHPTTRTCLELLLDLTPRGAFVDLGCGSGVLAILAARLGWSPVTAIDISPGAVAAAAENARRNDVAVTALVQDLSQQPPPLADGFAANVPPDVHEMIAGAWTGKPPSVAILSGFGAEDARAVSAAYESLGLRERKRIEVDGWVVLKLG